MSAHCRPEWMTASFLRPLRNYYKVPLLERSHLPSEKPTVTMCSCPVKGLSTVCSRRKEKRNEWERKRKKIERLAKAALWWSRPHGTFQLTKSRVWLSHSANRADLWSCFYIWLPELWFTVLKTAQPLSVLFWHDINHLLLPVLNQLSKVQLMGLFRSWFQLWIWVYMCPQSLLISRELTGGCCVGVFSVINLCPLP